jgi:hypothetical protein
VLVEKRRWRGEVELWQEEELRVRDRPSNRAGALGDPLERRRRIPGDRGGLKGRDR